MTSTTVKHHGLTQASTSLPHESDLHIDQQGKHPLQGPRKVECQAAWLNLARLAYSSAHLDVLLRYQLALINIQ